jgi:hypothetical protein
VIRVHSALSLIKAHTTESDNVYLDVIDENHFYEDNLFRGNFENKFNCRRARSDLMTRVRQDKIARSKDTMISKQVSIIISCHRK